MAGSCVSVSACEWSQARLHARHPKFCACPANEIDLQHRALQKRYMVMKQILYILVLARIVVRAMVVMRSFHACQDPPSLMLRPEAYKPAKRQFS